jgi:hypothetical protein
MTGFYNMSQYSDEKGGDSNIPDGLAMETIVGGGKGDGL